MKIMQKIRTFIGALDAKSFYTYMGVGMGIFILFVGLIMYRYYRNVHYWQQRIDAVNEQREQAQRILTQAQRVKKQRADVDALIAKDPGFKIAGYFNTVLTSLKLKDRNPINDTATIDHEGKYQEIVLKSKLTDLSMKELTELLSELEKNARIYTKELEIVAVHKDRPALDVALTISALEPKG